MREVRSLGRAGRKNQIVLAFRFMIEKGYGDEMTAYDIARKIDLRPQSPNFRDLLAGLVMDGTLTCRAVGEVTLGNKKQGAKQRSKFMYKLAKYEPPVKREIPIKANGRQVGQMSLF